MNVRHHRSAKKKSCQPSCDRSFVRSIPVSQGFRSGRGSSRSVKHGNVVQAGGGRGLRVNWSSKATWSLSALPRLLNESRLSDGGVRVPPRQGGTSSDGAEQRARRFRAAQALLRPFPSDSSTPRPWASAAPEHGGRGLREATQESVRGASCSS